jgi:hypothetical protein
MLLHMRYCVGVVKLFSIVKFRYDAVMFDKTVPSRNSTLKLPEETSPIVSLIEIYSYIHGVLYWES